MLRTFKLCTIYNDLQLNHNIVIAMSSNNLIIGETQDDPLSSLDLSLTP